jgi:acetyltransferase-like isoleucine patch superfamily enzyme
MEGIVFSRSDRLQRLIFVDHPRLAAIRIIKSLFQKEPLVGLSDKAVVSKNAKIGKDCYIGDFSVIGDACEIGNNTVIYQNVNILQNSNYFLWQGRRSNKNRSKTLLCKKKVEVLLTDEPTGISIVWIFN